MQASSLTSKIAGAAMFAAAATGLVYPATAAESFSPQECRAISATVVSVLKALGPSTVSNDFKGSLKLFIKPNGEMTCSGPKDISTPTVPDVAAFDTIMSQLESLKDPNPIYLQRAGVRSVDPSKVASNAALLPVVQPQ